MGHDIQDRLHTLPGLILLQEMARRTNGSVL